MQQNINNYSLYVHKNKVNGKCYVGITSMNPTERWGNSGNGYNKQVFWNAIQKYGWDNFEHIIVANNLSKDAASDAEIKMIYLLNSNDFNFGYNVSEGGDNVGRHFTKKVSMYKHDGTFVNTFDSIVEASKYSKVGQVLISYCCNGKLKTAKNFIFSYYGDIPEFTFANKCFTSVDQYDLFGNLINTFKSISEAVEKTGIPRYKISNCCNGKTKKSENYIFVKHGELPNLNVGRSTTAKVVIQFDLSGEILHKYKSIHEAHNVTKISSSQISLCCNNKLKSTGGYVWKFENKKDI